MKISIIIPTLNESQLIGRLIERLLTADSDKIEIIVVDGGSTDDTLEIAARYGVTVIQGDKSRAKQMNKGAALAQNEILYFVHADALPPIGYFKDGIESLAQPKTKAACYRSKFDCKHPIFRVNEFFTRFYWLVARGGDQSLFITKNEFERLGGFDESLEIMEEYPFIQKLMDDKKLAILPKAILISTRKYENCSWLKVSRANYIVFKLFKNGAPSNQIKERYKTLLS